MHGSSQRATKTSEFTFREKREVRKHVIGDGGRTIKEGNKRTRVNRRLVPRQVECSYGRGEGHTVREGGVKEEAQRHSSQRCGLEGRRQKRRELVDKKKKKKPSYSKRGNTRTNGRVLRRVQRTLLRIPTNSPPPPPPNKKKKPPGRVDWHSLYVDKRET